MEYLVMKTLAVEQPKLIMCMTALCKWTQPSHDAMQLGRDIIGQVRRTAAEDRENKQAILFEQQKALELLCVHEGWQWTNNTLIRELLWPELQEWGVQQPPTPSSNMVVEFALRMMGLVSFHCPPEHASSAHEIMKTLYTFLKSAQQSGGVVSWSIQTAVFESLLYLAPFSPELVSTACNSWLKENKDRMTEGMLGKVRGFYQCYMNKCPVLTLPDFVKASL
ncbi:little elongation complex subunit 1 [Lingula anatina]|uniref:Little elongation complex subunit 1 n=1 Tax=Lingula anatina TaxID=7574 RepID=A0A1S3JZU6_LINAN|nr:little elongation complex subunit 1 [Lingula anatina]|eukprot:XP_013415915.1 little elongation complex subunit 1 [Lingula anatina]